MVCKYCGAVNHSSLQCWRRPKKTRPKPSKSRSKAFQARKTVKRPSSTYDRKKLIKELDKYCSLYIRLSAADKQGNAACYCCGKKLPYKLGDCGHYCSRRYLNTRWYLPNMRFCCVTCNRYLNGNYTAYTAHLKRDVGADEIQKLWDRAYSRKKIPTIELAEMLETVKSKYKTLIETRQSKGWKC